MKRSTTIDGSAWERLTRRVGVARERAEGVADNTGSRAGATIGELRRLRRLIDELIDDETVRGREQGAPWVILGSSRQQAQQRHAAAIRRSWHRRPGRTQRSIIIDDLGGKAAAEPLNVERSIIIDDPASPAGGEELSARTDEGMAIQPPTPSHAPPT